MAIESVIQPVPTGWRLVDLGTLCAEGGGDVQTGLFGSQLHASDYVRQAIPSVMPVNIGDNRIIEDGIVRITNDDAVRLSKYRLRPGDIVYSRRGDVERRALVRETEDGWLCGTGCLRVRFGKRDFVDPLFASFYLGHPDVRSWIVRHAIGATMPNLNTKIMSSLPFMAPPLPEQKAIAHILGTLDDKIELNRRMNQTLEEMARAIFKSWFVDFDPVVWRAVQAGNPVPDRFADTARRYQAALAQGTTPYGMTEASTTLFPDAFQDSDLGPIPVGWEVGKVADFSDLNPEVWKKQTAPEEILYLDLKTVKWGDPGTPVGFRFSNAPSRARRILRHGDTILGTVRPANGSYAFVHRPEENLTGSTGFAVLRPKNSTIQTFNYLWLTQTDFIDYLAGVADGSAYPAVPAEIIHQAEAVVPPQGIFSAFASVTDPKFELMAVNRNSSEILGDIRDTLLPKLLSGEIRIKDAEKFVEAAT